MVKNNTCIYTLKKVDESWFEYTPQCNHEKTYISSSKLKADGTDYDKHCIFCARKIAIQTNISQLCKKLKSSIIPHKKWYKPRGE